MPIEHSPLELLMQLYEDTGFSRRMYQVMPEELTHGSTRAVGLACDLISCIAAARQEAREADPEYWKRREEIKARRAEQIRND